MGGRWVLTKRIKIYRLVVTAFGNFGQQISLFFSIRPSAEILSVSRTLAVSVTPLGDAVDIGGW